MAFSVDQFGNPWKTSASGYVGETKIFEFKGAETDRCIELGAAGGGLIDLVLCIDGDDLTWRGLRRQEIAEIGRALIVAAETAP